MSRIICPFSDEDMLCIAESRGDDINCDECPIKKWENGVKNEI